MNAHIYVEDNNNTLNELAVCYGMNTHLDTKLQWFFFFFLV